MEQENRKKRDIEHIIESVQEHIVDVNVTQLIKRHPADDDGIWWFEWKINPNNIQVESSSGMCPFLLETDIPAYERRIAYTVEEAIEMIVGFLYSTPKS
jgi:hypothetical protein